MDHDELRRQVMRRSRYGLNVVALERNMVPPEGPFDVALTNGLAAIVAEDHPGQERDKRGMLPASRLLKIAEDAGQPFDFAALREILTITQPLRHGRADDENLMPVAGHLEALAELDDHIALQVLEKARAATNVDQLVVNLYIEAASDSTGLSMMSPKDRIDQPDLEFCDECGRETFLPFGYDDYGGTDAPGECAACGYERDAETAERWALDAEIRRLVEKDD